MRQPQLHAPQAICMANVRLTDIFHRKQMNGSLFLVDKESQRFTPKKNCSVSKREIPHNSNGCGMRMVTANICTYGIHSVLCTWRCWAWISVPKIRATPAHFGRTRSIVPCLCCVPHSLTRSTRLMFMNIFALSLSLWSLPLFLLTQQMKWKCAKNKEKLYGLFVPKQNGRIKSNSKIFAYKFRPPFVGPILHTSPTHCLTLIGCHAAFFISTIVRATSAITLTEIVENKRRSNVCSKTQ